MPVVHGNAQFLESGGRGRSDGKPAQRFQFAQQMPVFDRFDRTSARHYDTVHRRDRVRRLDELGTQYWNVAGIKTAAFECPSEAFVTRGLLEQPYEWSRGQNGR